MILEREEDFLIINYPMLILTLLILATRFSFHITGFYSFDIDVLGISIYHIACYDFVLKLLLFFAHAVL